MSTKKIQLEHKLNKAYKRIKKNDQELIDL